MKNLYRYKWFRKLEKSNGNQAFYVQTFLIFFVMCIMGVGFAILTEDLTIGGTASIQRTFGIEITNIEQTEYTGSAAGTSNMINTLASSFDVSLPSIDSTITYLIEYSNLGAINGILKTINVTNNSNNNIKYDIRGLHENSVIRANTIGRMYITFYYDTNTLPNNTSLNITFNVTFEETQLYATVDNEVNEYGSIFYVSGNDDPVNNTWRERKSNYHLSLTNVVHNSSEKTYDFTTGSCAFSNIKIIPSTGDFTLETFFKTSSDISGDQAIVTQKSTSVEKDKGRFKININTLTTNNNGARIIKYFLNSGSTVYEEAFSGQVEANTQYYVQFVRKGGALYLYLNGVLIATKNFSATEQIGQNGTLQIGCWTNANDQNFIGSIYSVRIYDRAVEPEVLMENYNKESDHTGGSVIVPNSLVETIILRDLVTSGAGLYYEASDQKFYYRGGSSALNNYFRENGNIWRIMSVDSNNVVKLIGISHKTATEFDVANNRDISTFCSTQNNGCSVFAAGNLDITVNNQPMTDTITKDSTLATKLTTTIYNSLSNDMKTRAIESQWDVGMIYDIASSYDTVKTLIRSTWSDGTKNTWTSKIGTLSVLDLMDAWIGGRGKKMSSSGDNYLMSLSGNSIKSIIWTMNALSKNTGGNSWDIETANGGNTISARRANRTDQQNGSVTNIFYTFPVIYINGDFIAKGNGSSTTPFEFR